MNNFSITSIHHDLFEKVSKGVLTSMIGSMNFRSIAYAQMHLRADALENGQLAGETRGYKRLSTELNIDDRNEADAAIAEAKQREGYAENNGLGFQMPAAELCEHMMRIGDFFSDRVRAIGIKSKFEEPSTIADTIAYQLTMVPKESDKTAALALLLDVPQSMIKLVEEEDFAKKSADLKRNTGKIITYLERFTSLEPDESAVEASFDALAAHIQYKIIAKVISVYERLAKREILEAVRGRMDAAGNYKMLQAKRDDAIAWLTAFSKAKRIELNEYMDRGGELPEFGNTIVGDNDSYATADQGAIVGRNTDAGHAASARLKEDNDAREAELKAKAEEKRPINQLIENLQRKGLLNEPAVIGAPRRAKAKAK